MISLCRRPPLFAGCRLSNLRKRLFLREGVNLLLGKMATTRRSDYLTGRDTARAARQHLQRVSTSHEYGMVISAPHSRERDDRVATTCWIGKGTHVLCRRRGHAVRRCGLVAFPRAPPHPLRRGSLFFGQKAIGDRNAKPKLSGAGQSVVRKLSQGTRLRTAANPAVAGLPPPSQGRGLAPEEK